MPTPDDIINKTEEILKIQDSDENRLKINSLIAQILSYLNRDDVTDEMFPVVCSVIAELFSGINSGNVQSFHEGDFSVTFFGKSPFFGKLDGFKLIRGIK